MYPTVRTSLVNVWSYLHRLVQSYVAFIGVGVYPEVTSSLCRLSWCKAMTLTLGAWPGPSLGADAVCPVNRYVQTHSTWLVRQTEVCPVYRYGHLHPEEARSDDHGKYVRFIGMNVCLVDVCAERPDQKYVRFIGIASGRGTADEGVAWGEKSQDPRAWSGRRSMFHLINRGTDLTIAPG